MADLVPSTQAMEELKLEEEATLASMQEEIKNVIILDSLLEHIYYCPEFAVQRLNLLTKEERNSVIFRGFDRVGERLIEPSMSLAISEHPNFHEYVLSVLHNISRSGSLIDQSVTPAYLLKCLINGSGGMKQVAAMLFLQFIEDEVVRKSFGFSAVDPLENFLKEEFEEGRLTVSTIEIIILILIKLIKTKEVDGKNLVTLTKYVVKILKVNPEEFSGNCLLYLESVCELKEWKLWVILWAEEYTNETFSKLVPNGEGSIIVKHIQEDCSLMSDFFAFIKN